MTILKGVKSQIDVKVIANIDSDNGRTINVPFIVTSKKPNTEEKKETLRKIGENRSILEAEEAGVAAPDGCERYTDDEFIADYLIGWKGLTGEDGSTVEYNPENLAIVLDAPEYKGALVGGLWKALVGKDALAKNS